MSLHNISYQNRFFLALYAACFLGGCSSTPKSRIEAHQEVFSSYPPEVQLRIQRGEIDKGFDEEMVRLAKGEPDERTSEKVGTKTIHYWRYTCRTPTVVPSGPAAQQSFSGGFDYPTPGSHVQPMPMFYNRPFFSIEFEQGQVARWNEGQCQK